MSLSLSLSIYLSSFFPSFLPSLPPSLLPSLPPPLPSLPPSLLHFTLLPSLYLTHRSRLYPSVHSLILPSIFPSILPSIHPLPSLLCFPLFFPLSLLAYLFIFRYGIGYRLTMVKGPNCDVNRTQSLVYNHVADAKMVSDVGAELAFVLPSQGSGGFETLFKDLEGITSTSSEV